MKTPKNPNLVRGFGINDSPVPVRRVVDGKLIMDAVYRRWSGMIDRCYAQYRAKKYPTYEGCSVSSEWKRFSSFKRWMDAQDHDGLDLDKDIIHPGNKIYGPEFCCFVPHSINTLLNDCRARKGIYPKGVSFDKNRNKYVAYLSVNGTNKNLGRHATSEKAGLAYAKAKANLIRAAAQKQTDERIRNGLFLHAAIVEESAQ